MALDPLGPAEPLPAQSEDALALRFSEIHGDELRYVAPWNKWLSWNDRLWQVDDTLATYDKARAICRSAAAEYAADQKNVAARLAAANTVSSIERLARADRRHAATVDQWDSDPWLLNTPNGVVDLCSGCLRPARRGDYMTKITAVGPSGERPRRWREFLEHITAGDTSLQRFMQRMCGYALTGITREHALFFLYGSGGNGKTVFINTISGVLGNYARTAPVEAFIATSSEHHPTDLAGLQGARLVTAVETEDGRRWAESKLKALTGGDRICARFMRQDFFEYVPQFKLVIAGNHKPGLRTVDEAMRRRFHLLPFTVTIPASERDPELGEKLRREWGGILQWMIQGCLDWQQNGLDAPGAVRSATDEYLASEDTLARWMDDECVVAPQCWTSATALFSSWRKWCEENQEHAGSQRRFSQRLQSCGLSSERTTAARGFSGIGLREDL